MYHILDILISFITFIFSQSDKNKIKKSNLVVVIIVDGNVVVVDGIKKIN